MVTMDLDATEERLIRAWRRSGLSLGKLIAHAAQDAHVLPGDFIDRTSDETMVMMIEAAALRYGHPWNWCPRCSAPVDTPDESFDGSEVRCLGCRTVYVIVTDGEASELQSREEYDLEDVSAPAAAKGGPQ